jgi:8-amino-7-oxononanoate synthase
MKYFTNKLPSNTLVSDEQNYLWFSGTSYLGIPHHPVFKENFIKAIADYGTSWGSSRNNTVQLRIYEKAEKALADFAQMPVALTVSSGMWAGQLVVNFLEHEGYTFFFAPKTHPALWNGKVPFSSESYQEWTLSIAEKVQNTLADNIVICADSVGSPYVEYFDFEWINSLPTDKNITVVIDASHSLGIDLPKIASKNIQLIITSSLNKAMGMTGGVIFAEQDFIEKLRHFSMFSGASPMMPALLDAFVNSIAIFHEQRAKLLSNIQYFNHLIPDSNLDYIENYPAYCTHQVGLHEHLKEHGIMTACFPYPTTTDFPVTRLVISALHTKEELDKLAEILNIWR